MSPRHWACLVRARTWSTTSIEKHYKAVDRPYRACQPRDLLLQVVNFCHYTKREAVMSRDNFDFAAENYFAVM